MNVTQMTDYVKSTGVIFAYFTRAKMLTCSFGFGFFALISAIFVNMLEMPAAPVCSVILYVLLGVLVLCTVISMLIKYTFKGSVFYFTALSILMSLVFLVDSAAFCDMAGIELYGIAFVVPAFLAVYSICFMRPTPTKKGRKKGSAAVWVVPAITVSGSGFWLGKALHPAFAQMEQQTLNVILAIGFFVLGCVFSSGSFGILYLHYIRVLESKGVKL